MIRHHQVKSPGDFFFIIFADHHPVCDPTEIEPFGGAATCLGGAIRDPLSGRTYVYQAMRVTGAGDIKADFKDTLKGKLPQHPPGLRNIFMHSHLVFF